MYINNTALGFVFTFLPADSFTPPSQILSLVNGTWATTDHLLPSSLPSTRRRILCSRGNLYPPDVQYVNHVIYAASTVDVPAYIFDLPEWFFSFLLQIVPADR